MSATPLRRRHGIQKESRVFTNSSGIGGARLIGVGIDDHCAYGMSAA